MSQRQSHPFMPHKQARPVTRRDALCRIGNGFGMLAFASLVGESLSAAGVTTDQEGVLGGRQLDHPAKAKRVIFLFMSGGPSHVDLFDPKPDLVRLAGQPIPESFGTFKTRRAVAREIDHVGAATRSAMLAALNRFAHSPIRQRNARRNVHQAFALIGSD